MTQGTPNNKPLNKGVRKKDDDPPGNQQTPMSKKGPLAVLKNGTKSTEEKGDRSETQGKRKQWIDQGL